MPKYITDEKELKEAIEKKQELIYVASPLIEKIIKIKGVDNVKVETANGTVGLTASVAIWVIVIKALAAITIAAIGSYLIWKVIKKAIENDYDVEIEEEGSLNEDGGKIKGKLKLKGNRTSSSRQN